jgi:hypothetical protein
MDEWSDPRLLARLARDILAGAGEATLLMIEPVRASERATLLHDDDGTPRLWCPAGSAVAAAAGRRRPAILTVAGRSRDGRPLTLALAGRLDHVTHRTDGERPGDMVAVTLARVSVEVGREPDVISHPVALDAYVRGAPDPIAGYAARVLEHTNARHQNELRGYVSGRFDLPPAAVAGAVLSHLDRDGATVHWVDEAGAHTATLAFERPAGCPADLAAQLRARLSGPGES